VVEAGEKPLPEADRECGIDLGLTHFAVMDDGTKIAAPRFLRRAARLYGRDFRKIGRWEPTSQVCSACGINDGPKPLYVREWTCGACGTVRDRDVNAAKNIAALGRREAQNARGGQVRPPHAVAQASETGSLRGAA
jgi:transposase